MYNIQTLLSIVEMKYNDDNKNELKFLVIYFLQDNDSGAAGEVA